MRIADGLNKAIDASAILSSVRRRVRPRRFRIDFLCNRDRITTDVTIFRRSNGRWYVRFWLNGQRYMHTTGETDYTQAVFKAKEIIEKASQPKTHKRTITFSQLASEFENHIENRWMPSTVENDKSRLNSLKTEFAGFKLNEVTEHYISEYLERRKAKTVVRIKNGVRREQKIDISTINREFTSIKLIFQFAVEKGYIDVNPAQKIKPYPTVSNHDNLIGSNRSRGLTADELERLLGACRHSDNPILFEIVAIAALSGLRKGELRSLSWDDIDFEKNVMRVRQSKTKSVFFKPMPEELREILLSLRDKYPHAYHVICNQDGTAYGDWRRAFRTACRLAGLEEVCFHMLRHTCFSMLGNKGYSPLEIREYSGHKSLKMVERYTHISPKHVQDMANTIRLKSGAKVVQLKDET